MPDELTFEHAAARIARFMAAIAAIGTVVAFGTWGWRAGAGFLVGSGISALSFHWITGLVKSLADGHCRGTMILASRYLILAAAAYAIVRFSPISIVAAMAGIFVFTAAVFIEVALEIVYARK
jgi:hypothetical protein